MIDPTNFKLTLQNRTRKPYDREHAKCDRKDWEERGRSMLILFSDYINHFINYSRRAWRIKNTGKILQGSFRLGVQPEDASESLFDIQHAGDH